MDIDGAAVGQGKKERPVSKTVFLNLFIDE